MNATRCHETGDRPGLEITPDMREIYAVMADPKSWGESFLLNRDGSPRVYRDYQVLDLHCKDRKIVHLDGRAVGKTINLSTLLLHYTFINRGKSILVAAPYQGQLNTIIEEVEFQLGRNGILRNNIARGADGRLSIKRRPYFDIEFANGCKAYFRPAGNRGEAFRSLHVDFLLLDEAAWLPEPAWKAVRQCLNAGGTFRVYSTPNGLRDTTYYKITQNRKWRIFHWPSWIAPDWSEERERDLIDFYGGKGTPGWQHEVAGEHGAPSYGAFNAAQVVKAVKDLPDYRRVDILGESLDACDGERQVRDRLQTLLNLPGGQGAYWLGADLGYTADPSEILLFEEAEDETLSLILRVHAEHVPYPMISEVIAIIDRLYSPQGLGLDRGGNGTAVEQELLHLDKFRDNYFTGRLAGYDFGGSVTVGEDDAGRPIRKRTKEQMTSLINGALNRNRVRLPAQDPEVEDQLCTQTYILNDRGIVYSKGDDHIVDAMRCAFLRRSQEIDPQYGTEIDIPDLIFVPTGPKFNKTFC